METIKGKSMWVVKLGGSLLGTPELKHWLSSIAQWGDGQVVIVPGGGLFADAVRAAQQQMMLSEASAHKLAVLAMNQYAHVLIDQEPSLVLAGSELELAERSWQHRGIVWLPSSMVLADATIAESWDVTSDSLAAWLASKLNATKLVMVKSALPDMTSFAKSQSTLSASSEDNVQPLNQGPNVDVRYLAEQGVVDAAFPAFVRQATFECWLVDKQAYTHFAQGFDDASLHKAAYPIHVA
jgi:aspartokinase-like uncharacterized kinase